MNKRKKKNKALPLVILVVLLIALIGAYVLLQSFTGKTDSGDDSTIVSIPLADFSKDKIVSITYGDTELITIINENGKWHLDGDVKFPLDQTKASKMAESIVSLSASKEVESNDLAEFGLDTPALTVKVTISDGIEYSYAIGDVNSFNNMTYILSSDKVYIFNDTLSQNFGYTTDELMVISDSFPTSITAESIRSAILREADGTESEYNITEASFENIKKCFAFNDVNSYGLTEDEIASFGIKEDGAAVIIKYSTSTDTSSDSALLEASFEILLGEAEGKRVYALKDGNMTYNVDTDIFGSIFKDSSADTSN